jgi:hypothetical protein
MLTPTNKVSCKKKKKKFTWSLGLAVVGAYSLPLHLGSNLTVHACHSCGALHAHWVCRIFSGPWD